MFDIIIAGAISWDWVEPQRGQFDCHCYRWANGWAQANGSLTAAGVVFVEVFDW